MNDTALKPVYDDDDDLDSALAILHGLEHFHLCGSRLFAAKTELIVLSEKTDHDFSALNSTANIAMLCALGYTDQNFTKYLDTTARSVWTKCGCKIQVVLRQDLDGWMKMIDSINGSFYYNYLWKSGPSRPGQPTIKDILNQLYFTMKL